MTFEYKVVPAPTRGRKAKGVKTRDRTRLGIATRPEEPAWVAQTKMLRNFNIEIAPGESNSHFAWGGTPQPPETFHLDSRADADGVPGKLLRLGAQPFYIKSATYNITTDGTTVEVWEVMPATGQRTTAAPMAGAYRQTNQRKQQTHQHKAT